MRPRQHRHVRLLLPQRWGSHIANTAQLCLHNLPEMGGIESTECVWSKDGSRFRIFRKGQIRVPEALALGLTHCLSAVYFRCRLLCLGPLVIFALSPHIARARACMCVCVRVCERMARFLPHVRVLSWLLRTDVKDVCILM